MQTLGSHTLSDQQATFMRQYAQLRSERTRLDRGVTLLEICQRYGYYNEHDCDHNCERREPAEKRIQYCPVMNVFHQLRKKKILGINSARGMRVPHTVSDQSINMNEYGLAIFIAENWI